MIAFTYDHYGRFSDMDRNGMPIDAAIDKCDLVDQVDDPPAPPHRRPPGCALADLYAKDLARCVPLSLAEQQHYARLARQGDPEGFRIMVESNLRLVAKVARRYRDCGVPLLDLIEEGNLGLIRAVQKFDPERGFRFSSCAVCWICEYIRQAIRTQTRMMPLSSNTAKALKACQRAALRLSSGLDHEPTDQEIADAIHEPVERVIRLLGLNEEVIPLDALDGIHDDASLADTLADEEHPDLMDALTYEALEQLLVNWLGHLTARDREIICRRYGLDGLQPETLKGIGARLGVTDSRVQQIQVRALATLRSMAEEEGFDPEAVLH